RCRARGIARRSTRPSSTSATTQSREGRRPSQKRLAAWTAAAFDEPLAVRVVVVGELLASADPARGANPDRAVDDVDVAVRPAGMVDEPRVVAADAGVDHRAVGQLEAPDVAAPDVAA